MHLLERGHAIRKPHGLTQVADPVVWRHEITCHGFARHIRDDRLGGGGIGDLLGDLGKCF